MESARQGHLQLPRADAIRSRLIDTFSLIEHLQGLSQAVPRHTLREILDPSRQKKLMLGDQHQLVRFSIKPRRVGRISYSQRMLNRLHVRCSQRPPLCLWAGWVLENPFFANFITFLIMLNTLVLMVEIELLESTNTKLWPLKLTLEVAAWFILFMFILEILLMWLYNFFLFWKNSWNVFDFVITVLSLLPEIVAMAGISGNSVWLQMLRICRVLRSLKLIARFRQIRVIILALVRALKSMTFLLMLLLIFFYIFAVTGVYFFEDYTRSTVEDLKYNLFFSDLLNSLVTVFILFTLDHWYAILQDIWKVPESSRVFSSIYVILWLLLGSIIFRNIIVAMMVTNFQNIRNELSEEMTQLEVQHKADIFKRQIILRRQNLSPEAVKSYHSKMDDREGSEEKASEDTSEACESSADEQGADEQGAAGPSAAGPSAAGPSAAGPSTAGPSAAGPSAAGPSAAGPSAAGPSAAGPSAAGPSAAGPSAAGPSAAGPSAAGPSAAGPSTAGPSAAGPSAAGPSAAGPSAAGQSAAGQSAAGPSTAGQSTPGQSAAEEVTKSPSKTKEYPTSSSRSSSTSYSSSSSKSDSIDKLDWETLVHENLPGLMDMDQDDRVVWPRDSLFRYFELLEKLQYNLEERKKLQEFAVQALMNFEDR